ncbi:MAG TPA: F0F1 ATP synthase subunit epsilon [Candidatus Binatia bacterium]|nr:F0F1 ATP synthase subunit epsilon [Candidatus Acidoferrales bacterium]HUK52595.1 F0F1 ATP synthase subunit epsilon [Candidatus Binatia bacterium]
MEQHKLTLEVVTPEHQVLHEQVDFVQLPGRDGYLGILPGHAPLLTELGAGILSFEKDAVTYYATAIGGFAEVLGDRIIILAERSELAEEIDVGRARAAEQRALKRLEEKHEQVDFHRAQLALQRALIRMQVAPQVSSRSATPPYERNTAAHPPAASK